MATDNKSLAKVSEGTINQILIRVDELQARGLKLPPNYSPDNAVRAAWLIIQEAVTPSKQPVLEACSKPSIANALLKMVVNGLNPQKNQCYFIPYGNKLTCMPSYFGNIAMGKRAGLQEVKANLILEGDEFEFEVAQDGRKVVTKHKQTFDSLGGKIKGAYCVVVDANGTIDTDIMTIAEIKQSWLQGPTKGNSPAHRNFEGEMAKRTVSNRAIKLFVNTSDDANLFIDEDPSETPVEAHVSHQIAEKANKDDFGFDDAEIMEESFAPTLVDTPEEYNGEPEKESESDTPGW